MAEKKLNGEEIILASYVAILTAATNYLTDLQKEVATNPGNIRKFIISSFEESIGNDPARKAAFEAFKILQQPSVGAIQNTLASLKDQPIATIEEEQQRRMVIALVEDVMSKKERQQLHKQTIKKAGQRQLNIISPICAANNTRAASTAATSSAAMASMPQAHHSTAVSNDNANFSLRVNAYRLRFCINVPITKEGDLRKMVQQVIKDKRSIIDTTDETEMKGKSNLGYTSGEGGRACCLIRTQHRFVAEIKWQFYKKIAHENHLIIDSIREICAALSKELPSNAAKEQDTKLTLISNTNQLPSDYAIIFMFIEQDAIPLQTCHKLLETFFAQTRLQSQEIFGKDPDDIIIWGNPQHLKLHKLSKNVAALAPQEDHTYTSNIIPPATSQSRHPSASRSSRKP